MRRFVFTFGFGFTAPLALASALVTMAAGCYGMPKTGSHRGGSDGGGGIGGTGGSAGSAGRDGSTGTAGKGGSTSSGGVAGGTAGLGGTGGRGGSTSNAGTGGSTSVGGATGGIDGGGAGSGNGGRGASAGIGGITGGAGAAGRGGSGPANCVIACSTSAYCDNGMCKSRVTEFPVPANFGPPVRITTGPDNNLWFTGRDKVGRMTTTGEAVAFDLVTGAAPFGIAAGPDGNIWFSEGAGYIGRMTTNGASYVRFPMPTSAFVDAITVGVDGNLWVTGGQKIGVCTPSGAITERNPPMAADVHTIARGPGGTMWFVETGATPQLVRIASTGTMTEYAIPAEFTNPQGLVAGPDGNMWFTGGASIGRFNITQGSFAGFLVETNTGPNQIAVGPDGNLWATVQTSNDASLLRIVPDGSMTRFPLPAVPDGLTGGPDGNIWFTEPGFGSPGQIARFLIP